MNKAERQSTTPRRRRARAVDLLARDIQRAGLPVVAQFDEPRALPIYDTVPPGRVLWEIHSEKHAPHLKPGDWAVINTTARSIVFGELFLVLQSGGPVLWQLREDKRPGPAQGCAWLVPLNNKPPHLRAPDEPIFMSDGPMQLDYLAEGILGQVVGIFVGPRTFVDRLIAKGRQKQAVRASAVPPTIDGRAAR